MLWVFLPALAGAEVGEGEAWLFGAAVAGRKTHSIAPAKTIHPARPSTPVCRVTCATTEGWYRPTPTATTTERATNPTYSNSPTGASCRRTDKKDSPVSAPPPGGR